jgi:hypothetical protein
MYGKIDHWRTHADNSQNQFLKPNAHMLIADQIAMYLEDRDHRQIPQFTQDLFCKPLKDSKPEEVYEKETQFQKEIEKFDNRDISTNYSSSKSMTIGHSDSIVRLHVGSREPIKSEGLTNILTSSSSLKISKLTSKMRALEQVALKHRRGDFGMPEKDFLELVFCPYRGHSKTEKSNLREFLKFRSSIELPLDSLQLPMVTVSGMKKNSQNRQLGINLSKPHDSRDEEYDQHLESSTGERIMDYSKYIDLFTSINQMKNESRKAASSMSNKHAHIQEPLGIKRSQKQKLTAVIEPLGSRGVSPT